MDLSVRFLLYKLGLLAPKSMVFPSNFHHLGRCVRYLDHMLDQLNSHGQLRVSVQAEMAGLLLLGRPN